MKSPTPTVRVASRYLEARSQRKTKKKEKKERESLYDMLDSKFGGWSGCFKPTGNVVKYTTVKGWTYLSKKKRTDPLNKARYEFAMKLFEGFNKEMMKGVGSQLEGMRSEPNLGLDSDTFSEEEGRLNVGVEEVSKEDLESLAQELSKSFKTEGFERGIGAQYFDTFVADELLRNIKMLKDLGNPKTYLRKKEDDNSEVRSMTRSYMANWSMTTFIPMIKGPGTISSVNGLASTGATKLLAGLGAKGLAVKAVPFVAAMVAGSIFYKKVMQKTTQKMRAGEEGFDALAHDIFVGYQTPEGVEKEYKGKIDKILSDNSLSPKDAKEAMLKIHADFQENARPSIEKGVSQLGYGEGGSRSWGKALKLASEEGEDVPVFVRLSMFKSAMETRDFLAKELEDNYESLLEEMRGVLKGDEPVCPEMISYLKTGQLPYTSSIPSDKKANYHSERRSNMNQQQLKRQIVRQVMQRRASADPFERQIRTAGMLYEAGMKDDLKGLFLKYVANPLNKYRRHLDLFTMPVDDLLDDVVEAVAPKIAEAMLEQEVDADFEEFVEGAELRNQEKSLGGAGGYFPPVDPPQGKSDEFVEGYMWGDSNRTPVPASVKKRLIEEAAKEHDGKVIERALKKAFNVINPVEIAKHAFHIVKKHGWDADANKIWYVKWPMRFFKVVLLAIAVAILETIEHAVLPAFMVNVTGNPAWYGLAAVPLLEIILGVVTAYFSSSKKNVVDEPGHLDWYEKNYGDIENVLEPNVFTGDDDEDTNRRTASRYRYYGAY